ncbi:MIP-related peptides [Lingula anatina]|uniref:MIP-related peptides n=1 Tax=Lingula anatina TaxID=7574 RepID=A0A1S3J5N1_LINAN|nr:MIP-related peptides [Lingula anatina]|eukprot:XP_013405700.1 MIP-related peptides [Lingula anatina]
MALVKGWTLLSLLAVMANCTALRKKDTDSGLKAIGKDVTDEGIREPVEYGIFVKTPATDDTDGIASWLLTYDPVVIVDVAKDGMDEDVDGDLNVDSEDVDDRNASEKRRFKGGVRAYMLNMFRPGSSIRNNPAFLGKRDWNQHETGSSQISVDEGTRRPRFFKKRGSRMQAYLANLMRSQTAGKHNPAFLGKRQVEVPGIQTIVPQDIALQKPRFIGKRDVQDYVQSFFRSKPSTRQKPGFIGKRAVKSRSKRDLKSYVSELFRAKQGNRQKPRFIGKRDVRSYLQNMFRSYSNAKNKPRFIGKKSGDMSAFLHNMFRSQSSDRNKPSFLGKRDELTTTAAGDDMALSTSDKRSNQNKPRFLGKRNS